ncbi:hypothetical protein ACEW7V_02515 [Areca yellow leaf disease phytoplasma]|uniref:hypothetical protein n=1 Tax=Areca yellow leaf disease phytoplasma TaxID=927614 RepID=UPI0035B5599A
MRLKIKELYLWLKIKNHESKTKTSLLKYIKLRLELKKKADYVGLSQISFLSITCTFKKQNSIDGEDHFFLNTLM